LFHLLRESYKIEFFDFGHDACLVKFVEGNQVYLVFSPTASPVADNSVIRGFVCVCQSLRVKNSIVKVDVVVGNNVAGKPLFDVVVQNVGIVFFVGHFGQSFYQGFDGKVFTNHTVVRIDEFLHN
jgi:hypothetical protein